jgi:hypothetical protein
MGAGMSKCIADLAQDHQAEGRRQLQAAHSGLCDPRALRQRHF